MGCRTSLASARELRRLEECVDELRYSSAPPRNGVSLDVGVGGKGEEEADGPVVRLGVAGREGNVYKS